MDLFILVPIYICGSSAVAKLMWFTLPPHTYTPLFCYTHNPYIYFYIILIASFPIIVNSSSVFSLQALLYLIFLSYSLYSTLYIQLIHMANSTVELSLHIVMKICRESYLGFSDISRLLLVKGKVHSVKR